MVHWGAPMGSSGSSAVIGFIGVRYGGRRIRPLSLGAPLGSSGSSGVPRFIRVRPSGRRVNQGVLVSLGCALGVVGFTGIAGRIGVRPEGLRFIESRWVAPLGSSGLSGVIGLRPRGHRVYPGSLGSFWCAWESSRSSANAAFIGLRLGVVGFIRGYSGAH